MSIERTKKCPFCGERINAEAVKCRFCKEFLEDNTGLPVSNHAKKKLPPRPEQPNDSDKDEPDFITATPSLWGILGTLITSAIFFTIGMILLLGPVDTLLQRIPNMPAEHRQISVNVIRYGGLVIIFLVLLNMLYKVARIKSVRYEIGMDRIEWIRGIFNRKIDNLDMFRVIDIKLHRSLLDCILGIGTLTLITKDKSNPTFDFERISNPKKIYDFIKRASLAAERKQGVIHTE